MHKNDLTYTNLQKVISKYSTKGRSESASFLNWFLENIYRLSDVDADDTICDERNDKGIDGIYVDDTAEEIHFFQSKITQKDGRTLGDSDLKAFFGSLNQFSKPESIDIVLNGNANQELKKIINRTNIKNLVSDGYKVVGIFVTNQDQDNNCIEYLKHVSGITVYDRERIVVDYIDFDVDEGVKGKFDFDISYAGCLDVSIDDATRIFMFPATARELIKLSGIDDTSLFKQNVRLTLGNTSVNKSIASSISDSLEHKNFPLYHNGITILCRDARISANKNSLQIEDYVVVNGAQSISTFYKNASLLSNDLRVFVKAISLRNDELARKITINSNNQNAIKARDLRSNHNIMLRLKAEFEKNFPTYSFEIKRGEEAEEGRVSLTNEMAGRLLMAFDIGEPYSCHQIYKVFDDKYSDIFGRPEVTASRIIFLKELYDVISDHVSELKNEQMAGYALTRFFFMNVMRHIMEKFDKTRSAILSRNALDDSTTRSQIIAQVGPVISEIIIDFNYEMQEEGESLDYKRDLKSPERVRIWRNRLLSSYDKELKKGKAAKFD